MNMPQIIRIDASAGSGKTYRLSTRYLQLIDRIIPMGTLKGENISDDGDVCGKLGDVKPQINSIAAILAITFTNRAAAEMKERVLLILKEIALNRTIPEGITFHPKKALITLFHIIENYSDFNVMTIDAFMNTILNAFAVEAGRLPDYELNFSPMKLYALALDRLMEKEEQTSRLFLPFLDHLLTVERKSGFNPEGMIRKSLTDLRKAGISYQRNQLGTRFEFDEGGEWRPIATRLQRLFKDLEEIQDTRHCFKSNIVKPSKHLRDLERKQLPKWLTDKRGLSSLLKKGAKPDLSLLEALVSEVREMVSSYFTRLEIKKYMRVMRVFLETLDEEAALYRDLNLFDGSRLPEKVQELLFTEPMAVPAAFCKLGERYFHYLIDEFQDTSKSQWEGMTPLVENSLAEGGSLFYVGDAKQAIYGWRGGDYRLIHEVINSLPAAWSENHQTLVLKTNRRSRRVLVNFFNTLFDANGFEETLDAFIDDPGILSDLKEVYKNSHQDPILGADGGTVSARFFQVTNLDTESHQPVKEAFLNTLARVRRSYQDKEILILGRRNEDIEEIAGWLFESPTPIPFVTEQSLKLFNIPLIKSVLNLLSYLVLPSRDTFLHAVVLDGLLGALDSRSTEEILSRYTHETPFEDFFLSTFPELDERYLAPLRRLSTILSPYELIREIIALFELPKRFPYSLPLFDRLLEQVLIREKNGMTYLGELIETFYETAEETRLVLPETPDVLRLMTIHKAKGLEAEVVIIPLMSWSLRPLSFDEVVKLEPGRYAKISRFLCQYNDMAEVKRREIVKKTFIENFNLLYVAMTRAKEALHLLVPLKERGKNIGEIFHQLCIHHGYLQRDTTYFETGEPPTLRKREVRGRTKDVVPAAYLYASGNIRSYLRIETEREEETWIDEYARRIGNLAHLTLSYIQILPSLDHLERVAGDALTRAVGMTGFAIDRNMENRLIKMVADTLHALAGYFVNIEEAWVEKELISDCGEIIRVDRLVRRIDGLHVLEFKTGKREEAHLRQVRRYLRIARHYAGDENLSGILYYLESGDLIHV